MTRYLPTEEQWGRLAPPLPPGRPRTGRPNKDHRLVVEAILWRLRTGAPWRDLPAEFGPRQTAYSRFRRWRQAGVWERVLAALQAEGDARGELDWGLHLLGGTTVRAHPHAAGAKKGAAIAPSAAPAAASRPSSTSAPSGVASRSASS